MSRVRVRALAVVLAAGAILGSSAVSRAAGTAVGASPHGGDVAYGFVLEALGRGTPSFEVMMGVPAAGATTAPGSSVDLSRPWVLLREWNLDQAGNASVGCTVESNPANWGLSLAGQATAYVDVSCADGSPFSFYRVTLTQWGPSWQSRIVAPLGQQWGAMYGSPAAAAISGEQGLSYYESNLQVCGYLSKAATAAGPWVCGQTGGSGYITPMTTFTTTLLSQ
jgi:hypothetical protein